jgi:putative copper resistance protein D
VASLLDIAGWLSVILRGLSLAFEALTLGGIIFLNAVAPLSPQNLRWLRRAALLLAATQICTVAITSLILMDSTGLKLGEIAGAQFWTAGALTGAGALAIAVFASGTWFSAISPFASLAIVIGSVMASHSVARLEYRWFAVAATLLHHLASAAWIGGLPYLLTTLRRTPAGPEASGIAARFSRLAIVSVAFLVAAGAAMAFVYVGSAGAAIETTYGVMLLAKVILTAMLLVLGALNWEIVQVVRRGETSDLLPLRRFGEAEVGIGFTILLAAASLTSATPAIDVQRDRVSPQEIAQRMAPRWPRLETPPVSMLTPATPLAATGTGQAEHENTDADIAWSEYNHHWAGLIVLACGILALLGCSFPWARHWPLAFFGLAAFLLIRADSESWPLGPRGFWESFQVAEVAQHRFFVLLIVLFAVFEWAVQTGRLTPRRAGLVFPLVCATGGAVLMTHSHSFGNVEEEFLAELSHLPLAVFAVIAGWSRWVEIRLPSRRTQALAWVWPVCFILIGSALILYRES